MEFRMTNLAFKGVKDRPGQRFVIKGQGGGCGSKEHCYARTDRSLATTGDGGKSVKSLLCTFQTEIVILWDMDRKAYPYV
jgi:hypothetical protein